MTATLVPGSPVARAAHDLIDGRRGVVLDPGRAVHTDMIACQVVAHLMRRLSETHPPLVAFPALDGEVQERAEQLEGAFRRCGFPAARADRDDIEPTHRYLGLVPRDHGDAPLRYVLVAGLDRLAAVSGSGLLVLTGGISADIAKRGLPLEAGQVIEVRRRPKLASAMLFANGKRRFEPWGPMSFEVLLAGAPA